MSKRDSRLLGDDLVMPYVHDDGWVTFGIWWMGHHDDRYRVTFEPATGRVVAVMLVRHDVYVTDVAAIEPETLGYADSAVDVARHLAGFEGQMRETGSLDWARARLAA